MNFLLKLPSWPSAYYPAAYKRYWKIKQPPWKKEDPHAFAHIPVGALLACSNFKGYLALATKDGRPNLREYRDENWSSKEKEKMNFIPV
jgi:hypothetical protein